MLTGSIRKSGRWWFAECGGVGAYTQGRSRKDALAMLADCIECLALRKGFEVRVTELGSNRDGSITVLVEANQPGVLAAEVLRAQRQRRRLTADQIAERLGISKVTYQAYELGRRELTLTRFEELLKAIAPELGLAIDVRQRRQAR
jgi:DNA-binding XRE family transcriptional regulator